MKKKFFLNNKHLFILLLFSMSMVINAQQKIGSNPTTISSNTNLEVEATNGSKFKVSSDTGKVTIADGTHGDNKILVSDSNGTASWVAQNAVTPNVIIGSTGSAGLTCSFADITGTSLSLPVGIWNIYVGGIIYSGSANFVSGTISGGQTISGQLPYFDVLLANPPSNTGTYTFISSNSVKVPLVNLTQNEFGVNFKVIVTSGIASFIIKGSSCLPGIPPANYLSNFVVSKFNAIDN